VEKVRFISVPLNEQGMDDYNYGVEDSKNITEIKLDEDKFDKVYFSRVFNDINEKCNLLIDDYESEVIKGENLKIALDISKKKKCGVLIQAIELAIEKNTLVGLDF